MCVDCVRQKLLRIGGRSRFETKKKDRQLLRNFITLRAAAALGKDGFDRFLP